MIALGWAQLHRDLHIEVSREALVLDVRSNGGGHTSQLVWRGADSRSHRTDYSGSSVHRSTALAVPPG
ncbi:MAG: hypothetical protein M3319_12020 [Actinomycetota bacterium]|nr:hypothetical protein [Actinomycetota bacterium]